LPGHQVARSPAAASCRDALCATELVSNTGLTGVTSFGHDVSGVAALLDNGDLMHVDLPPNNYGGGGVEMAASRDVAADPVPTTRVLTDVAEIGLHGLPYARHEDGSLSWMSVLDDRWHDVSSGIRADRLFCSSSICWVAFD